MEETANWSKPNVYNLANVSESIHEVNVALPMVMRNDAELISPYETTTTTTVAPTNLVEKASKTTHSVLNRPREETIDREVSQSTEIQPSCEHHQDDAREEIEQNELLEHTNVSKAISLNAPQLDTAYFEEHQLDEIVQDHHDEDVDLVIPNIRREDEADLANPPISKKPPLLLNKAALSEGSIFNKSNYI